MELGLGLCVKGVDSISDEFGFFLSFVASSAVVVTFFFLFLLCIVQQESVPA